MITTYNYYIGVGAELGSKIIFCSAGITAILRFHACQKRKCSSTFDAVPPPRLLCCIYFKNPGMNKHVDFCSFDFIVLRTIQILAVIKE